jgi:hypothetical protein
MRYEITVKGTLDPGWADWLTGMSVTVEARPYGRPLTVLAGEINDQAALRGLLNKLWDLNLALVSLTCIDAQEESDETDLHLTLGR